MVKDTNTVNSTLRNITLCQVSTSLRGLGGVDTDPMLTSVLSSNVAGIVMFSSTRTAGASSFGFLGGRPGLRPDFGCNVNYKRALMPHSRNVCLRRYSICTHMTLTFDVWPWKTFQQYPLSWRIFVASFIEISPSSRDHVTRTMDSGLTGWGTIITHYTQLLLTLWPPDLQITTSSKCSMSQRHIRCTEWWSGVGLMLYHLAVPLW